MTELLDEIAAKFDVKSFAKKNTRLLGSAALAAVVAAGVSIWRIKGASDKGDG